MSLLLLSLIFQKRSLVTRTRHFFPIPIRNGKLKKKGFPYAPKEFLYHSLSKYPYQAIHLYFGIIRGKGKLLLVMVDLRQPKDDQLTLVTGDESVVVKYEFMENNLIFLSKHQLFYIPLYEVLREPRLSVPTKLIKTKRVDDFTISGYKINYRSGKKLLNVRFRSGEFS